MTTQTDQRIREITAEEMDTERVRMIAGWSGLTTARVSGLYAVATVVGGIDMGSALRCTEQAARLARSGDASDAMRVLHGLIPGNHHLRGIDGTRVQITLPTQTDSRELVALPGAHVADHREQVHRWQVHPDLAVRWRHQVANRWNPAESAVGTVLGVRTDPVTLNLTVWCRLHRPDVIEAALYRQVSASPGIDLDGSRVGRGWSARTAEHTQTWTLASVLEVSLCMADEAALGGVQVDLVRGVPADAADTWTQTRAAGRPGQQYRTAAPVGSLPAIRDWDEPRSARPVPVSAGPGPDDGPPLLVTAWATRTPGGQIMQTRVFPDLPPLRFC